MTIADYQQALQNQSAVEVVRAALQKAQDTADYNVFITMTAERALERAAAVDRGEITGRLAGVPFAVKDNFAVDGAPTTAASQFLATFTSPIQATAVERLEAEGAICIGKVNLDAFAHGGSTENSAFGPTKNAVDATRVAGGSSGGSAVAVALDIVPFTLGTDTGGSIRQPASFNGVVGFKPTYGAVSRYGVVAMASGTDCIGVLSQSVSDSELVMSIMAGQDAKDSVTHDDYFTPQAKPNGKKLAVITDCMGNGVEAGVKASINQAIDDLRQAGYSVDEVSMKMMPYALAIYYIVVPAEISSNLARYDGVRYGARAEAKSLAELYSASRAQGFMPENKRRIMIGSYVLSSGYFDAYYQKAQQARTLLIREYDELFTTYDALLAPVAPRPAFALGSHTSDPVTMYLEDTMTVPASLAGLPAVSVPVAPADGLPVGLQIIGAQQADAHVLALARQVEGFGRG